MKTIEEKIDELEKTVKTAIFFINRIKNDNAILLEENKRLQEEYNQLRKIIEGSGSENTTGGAGVADQRQSDLKIELIKKELDLCIDELQAYIIQNKN